MPNATLIPTAPTFLCEAVTPLAAVNPNGTVLSPVNVVRFTDAPDQNRYALTFQSLKGKTYYIQYSSDGFNWTTVLTPYAGTGGILVWLDNGAPKTTSDSATVTQRFYQVVVVNNP